MAVIYNTASSLDGFLADDDDSLDWLLRQDHDPDGSFSFNDFLAEVEVIVMGATTYGWILDQLASTGASWEYSQPCWVFTHRQFPTPEGAEVRFVSGPVADHIDELTERVGRKDIWVVGGGDLAGQFADLGRLDQVVISYAPVTLGSGRPLLPRVLDLELVESARNRAFVCARFAVRGDTSSTSANADS